MVVLNAPDSSAVQLRQVKEILRRYCQGLTAKDIQVQSTKDLTEKGIGWSSTEMPATEGTSIFLPGSIDEFPSEQDNFAHFKVLATHQAAHLEFGTFDFSFQRTPVLFADSRSAIQSLMPTGNGSLSDFQLFFDLFEDRKLASDIFMVVEDSRIDYRLKHEYRGIREPFERAQRSALEKRPQVTSLPMREALLEILIQLSIENWGFFPVPPGQSQKLASLVTILRRVRSRRASVEDSAEATIRIYNILNDTENINFKPHTPENWDSSNPLEGSLSPMEDDLDNIVSEFMTGKNGSGRSNKSKGNGREEPYDSPRDVDYRGGIKPELVQTLRRLKRQPTNGSQSEEPTLSSEALERLFENSVEIEAKANSELFPAASQVFVQKLMKERAMMGTPLSSPELKPSFEALYPAGARPNNPGKDEAAFLYDEWDFILNNYRRRWCYLRQRKLDEGSPDFYAATVRDYAGLVATVRREFERLRTQRFKKVRRLQDGEELDFDSVIDAVVEKRAGTTPSDKIYWRRNKVERDVCVLFLLDMSASTYESISGGYRLGRSGSFDGGEKSKRIIDVEKESIVILVEALEAIGDAYGIYGFSGHGKDNVEFYTIKDVSEELTLKTKKRIEKIAPAQETRMGTAIRHATAVLDGQDYKTRLLLLLSDGRPQDHDYGAHHFRDTRDPDMALLDHVYGGSSHSYDQLMKEYAVYDTRMALLEAKQKGITPFCLTIDRRGHDYLKAMCGDLGYEVLDDITALPSRLPSLYRRLTT